MDGTLVDSTDDVEKHWTLWAERRGLDPAAVLVHAHGSPTRETVARFVDADEVAAETAWVEDLSLHTAHERALPGALDLLSQRFLPVAVVTSATTAVAPVRLRRAGLPVPAVLVTADDVRSRQARSGAVPAGRRPARRRRRGLRRRRGHPRRRRVDAGGRCAALAVTTTFPAADLAAAVAVLADLAGLRVEPGAVSWGGT